MDSNRQTLVLPLTCVVSMSCFQCLGRIAGLRRSATRGMDTRKFFIRLSKPLNTSSSRTCSNVHDCLMKGMLSEGWVEVRTTAAFAGQQKQSLRKFQSSIVLHYKHYYYCYKAVHNASTTCCAAFPC